MVPAITGCARSLSRHWVATTCRRQTHSIILARFLSTTVSLQSSETPRDTNITSRRGRVLAPQSDHTRVKPSSTREPTRDLLLDVLRGLPSPREARLFLQRSMMDPTGTGGSLKRAAAAAAALRAAQSAPSRAAAAANALQEDRMSTDVLAAADALVSGAALSRNAMGVVIVFVSPEQLLDGEIATTIGNLCGRLPRLMFLPIIVLDSRFPHASSSSSIDSSSNSEAVDNKSQTIRITQKLYPTTVDKVTDMQDVKVSSSETQVDKDTKLQQMGEFKQAKSSIARNGPRPGFSSTMASLLDEALMAKSQNGNNLEDKFISSSITNSESNSKIGKENDHTQQSSPIGKDIPKVDTVTESERSHKATITSNVRTSPKDDEEVSGHRHHFAKFREDVSYDVERLAAGLAQCDMRAVPVDGFFISDLSTNHVAYSTSGNEAVRNISNSNCSLDFNRILQLIGLGCVPVITPIGIDDARSRYIYVDPRVNCLKLSEGLSFLVKHKKAREEMDLERSSEHDKEEDEANSILHKLALSGNVKLAVVNKAGGYMCRYSRPSTGRGPSASAHQSNSSSDNVSQSGSSVQPQTIGGQTSGRSHVGGGTISLMSKYLINLKAEHDSLTEEMNSILSVTEAKIKLLKTSQVPQTSATWSAPTQVQTSQWKRQSGSITALKDIALRMRWQQDAMRLMDDCLSVLPSTATGILSHPQVCAKSVIQHIITDKPPAAAAHIEHGLMGGSRGHVPATSFATGARATTGTGENFGVTIVRRGLSVRIWRDAKIWDNVIRVIDQYADENNVDAEKAVGYEEVREFLDPDMAKLLGLLEASFGRKLQLRSFAQRMADVHDTVIVVGDHEGCAIVTRERFVGDEGLDDTNVTWYYLDKFAVQPRSQGSGAADMVWQELRRRYPQLSWRSRTANPVNGWYFVRAQVRVKLGPWTAFAYGAWPAPLVAIMCGKGGVSSIPASFRP